MEFPKQRQDSFSGGESTAWACVSLGSTLYHWSRAQRSFLNALDEWLFFHLKLCTFSNLKCGFDLFTVNKAQLPGFLLHPWRGRRVGVFGKAGGHSVRGCRGIKDMTKEKSRGLSKQLHVC